ncbi:MAG TPA: mismatch-specific DNA-glycosylase [Candidatus Binataceae bacterium]|nr:mismatch-specific DNA-glycosylase [Candidatus Binataceae bacterium]
MLRDVIGANPVVLLVGINPSLHSERLGHHFAGPGNPFWRLLHASGLVPIALTCAEDQRLSEFGLALTNLCARASASAAELRRDEFEEGKRQLRSKIERLKPKFVVFVGLSAYQQFFGKSRSGGAGLKEERIAGARVFVLPNPSGRNASFPGFEDKLRWFRRLAELLAAEPL